MLEQHPSPMLAHTGNPQRIKLLRPSADLATTVSPPSLWEALQGSAPFLTPNAGTPPSSNPVELTGRSSRPSPLPVRLETLAREIAPAPPRRLCASTVAARPLRDPCAGRPNLKSHNGLRAPEYPRG